MKQVAVVSYSALESANQKLLQEVYKKEACLMSYKYKCETMVGMMERIIEVVERTDLDKGGDCATSLTQIKEWLEAFLRISGLSEVKDIPSREIPF